MRSVAITAAFLSLCLPTCLVAGPAQAQTAAAPPLPDPEDGTVENGMYISRYFGLSYPLPAGMKEGLAGPEPSYLGYYVLSLLNGERATILITANDTFFAPRAFRDGLTMADEIRRSMSAIEGHTIDVPPSQVDIAGRTFARVDYNGVGLYRSSLITPVRCHLVSFNITTSDPGLRDTLVKSLDRLDRIERDAGDADPVCKANEAPVDRLVKRIDPPSVEPYLPPIPVRLTIDADGGVKHLHVIRATAGQRDLIKTALAQWRFHPPALDGGSTALETGLLVQFAANGGVSYLDSDRARE